MVTPSDSAKTYNGSTQQIEINANSEWAVHEELGAGIKDH